VHVLVFEYCIYAAVFAMMPGFEPCFQPVIAFTQADRKVAQEYKIIGRKV